MSRRWNIFRKKSSAKADSHGTTTAEEDLQFQPVLDHPKEPARLSEKQSSVNKPFNHHSSNSLDEKYKDALQRKERRSRVGEPYSKFNSENIKDIVEDKMKDMKNWEDEKFGQLDIMESNKGLSLMKPPPNVGSMAKDVSICDEYSDPYDMLTQKSGTSSQPGGDGYREPYNLELTSSKDKSNLSYMGTRGNYHDPWDKSNGKLEYDDPWNSNPESALAHSLAKSTLRASPSVPLHPDKPEPRMINDSQASMVSSSSASPGSGTQRLIRFEHSRNSPRTSPQFDGRLVYTRDARDNYSEPWGNQTGNKHFDNRLIKAEPSLEELRRISPACSGGTNSPNSSGRATPSNSSTIQRQHLLARLNEPYPAATPHTGNSNNWSKSRSLDMHKAASEAMSSSLSLDLQFRRSVSDDNLITASVLHVANSSASNPQLNGLDEYEEPWDRPESHSIMHSHLPQSTLRSVFGSVDGQGDVFTRNTMIGDRDPKGPADHLQSMQRFQQRKLELHPSEAINAKDIDPFLPLHNQGWYHGDIAREEAELRLQGKPNGSFLVRKSKSSKDSYSLSVQSSKGCVHILLKCTRDDNWILGEFSAPFLSASEMVAHYRRYQLRISDTESLVLSYPIENGVL